MCVRWCSMSRECFVYVLPHPSILHINTCRASSGSGTGTGTGSLITSAARPRVAGTRHSKELGPQRDARSTPRDNVDGGSKQRRQKNAQFFYKRNALISREHLALPALCASVAHHTFGDARSSVVTPVARTNSPRPTCRQKIAPEDSCTHDAPRRRG